MLVSNEVKRYGSESCHAYDREGNPQHSVPYKDKKRKGEMRPTTLRDIKERGWYPSVSAILGVVEKKGLDGWKKRQVAEACLQEGLERGVSNNEEFILQSLERAETNMTKARDLGTEIHGAIERYLGKQMVVDDVQDAYYLHIKAARNALEDLGVWGQPFSAERTFTSPLGYGGTVDFRSDELIADFKCVDRLDKKLAYEDRCSQLVAYNRGADSLFADNTDSFWVNNRLPKFQLVNIFISTSEPGKYLIHEWSTEEKERGWEMFKACFQLWKIVNRYDPLSVKSS